MLTRHLRLALRSPLPSFTAGLRQWWHSGGRIRRARMLCTCADEMRLQRVPRWQERSSRLYRRSLKTLGELAEPQVEAEQDAGLVAHRGLRCATRPYRAFWFALLSYACLLAIAASLAVATAAWASPAFRARLFPPDLAAGKPWVASDGDLGLPPSGIGPSSVGSVFFHTSVMHDPSVEIDLGAEHVIRSLRVDNRTDCCQERALPLNFEIFDGKSWRLVAQRRAAFSVWKVDVAPVRARRVRLRRPGTGYFHLKRVSVYGQ